MRASASILGFACFFALGVIFADEEDALPIVLDGFVVDTVAREPLVRNPSVLAFDRLGRLFVGHGPQWRKPRPQTPGDRVDILLDDDGDGDSDRVKTFADGFNCIQGLAWKGRDLWVANSPDLTVVRDVDGDDVADEYVRVYTGLGNLEHALHGLNFGPDGKLYMSKGNSRGYNRLDQLAPRAFRELWGLPSPEGAPDYTPLERSTPEEYARKYHTPKDDWGQQGGILRCDPDGRGLEIVSRGFRNPWDIAFDDGFDWLGTDNDQGQGDKIFAPFYGAHFGWGHSWSFHWTGVGHLPTVPASAPLFEGSGTGVVYYSASHFPPPFRDVFFVNDWMRREIYLFRPRWDGALLRCEGGFPSVFARSDGRRSLAGSSGRVFDPTDIEVGPDGAIYVASWGHGYGATIANGEQVDAGRIYRIRHADSALASWSRRHRARPIAEWSLDELFADLGSHVPAWRTDAQDELLRRGADGEAFLLERWRSGKLSKAQDTWTLWTLGRRASASSEIAELLEKLALDATQSRNVRIQALRILAFCARRDGRPDALPASIERLLVSKDARLRHETVQAIGQARRIASVPGLVDLAAREADRVTFYSTWNVLRKLTDVPSRREWLTDKNGSLRLAALLGLLEDDALEVDEVLVLREDSDRRVADLANLWLEKTGGAAPLVRMSPPPGEYPGPVSVTLSTDATGVALSYTLDGSTPASTSSRYQGPILIDRDAELRVAVLRSQSQDGRVVTGIYRVRPVEPYRHRAFIRDVVAKSGRDYRMDWTGLLPGKQHYTDRSYHVTSVPPDLLGLPFLRTANADDRSSGRDWLQFTSDSDVTVLVGVDVRVTTPPAWMEVGREGGFEETELRVSTTDPEFRLYRKRFPKGRIVLGGNTDNPRNDSRRGFYTVVLERELLSGDLAEREATEGEVLAALPTADAERGRELFLHPRGAGCVKCHHMEGRGAKFAPDLSDTGSGAQDPRVLIQSILEPSAVITEGFAQQVIVTKEGRALSGAVLEETGRSVRIVDSDAKTTTIARADIASRSGTDLSPMPAGFGRMMSAQQIADIVAWLGSQKSVGDRSGFSFQERPDRVDIRFGAQRIATYLKRHEKLTRRALVNVVTPGGVPLTRNFPPRKPQDIDPGYQAEDGIIHPVMHPGIWVGFGDIDGNDYWRLRARVDFDGFVEPFAGDKRSGRFAVRNLYRSEDGAQTVCTEITRYRFRREPEGVLLRLDAEYRSDERDFYFGDQEESGLAMRVASAIRVQGGNGSIVNDRGERNGAGTWGKAVKWFDFGGTIAGRRVGMMVVPSPSNARPSWLHSRDYGVVVVNPFPRQPKERREPYVKTWVRRGETYRLSWAVLMYDLASKDRLEHDSLHRRMLEMLGDD